MRMIDYFRDAAELSRIRIVVAHYAEIMPKLKGRTHRTPGDRRPPRSETVL